jgi:sortase (surface protein transpeptidase)
MTTYDNGSDRAPARRVVPALISLGLVLVIAWLLVAIDRQGRLLPQPGAAAPPGPSTLSIPSIGVRAAIVAVGRRPNGAMQTPDPGQVGWYRFGPWPGEPGPAVLVGHVDTKTGPDVFHPLRQLRPGDEILVGQPDGTATRFLVGRLEQHPKTALPTNRIWTKANRPLLRLITCAGSYDHTTHHYRDNLIVYASPTGS